MVNFQGFSRAILVYRRVSPISSVGVGSLIISFLDALDSLLVHPKRREGSRVEGHMLFAKLGEFLLGSGACWVPNS